MKKIILTKVEEGDLIICLNCELRVVKGPHADSLNSIFRQLTGRDHDVWARNNPTKTKPNESWYKEV